MHHFLQKLTRNGNFGNHLFAAPVQGVEPGMFFIGVQISRHCKMFQSFNARIKHPVASRMGGFGYHILTSGISSCEIKAQPKQLTNSVLLNILKLTTAGGLLGNISNLVKMYLHPLPKLAGEAGVFKHKNGRTLHSVVYHGASDAPREARELHATVVAGHEGAFGGGHWHKKCTLGVFAVHVQWSRKANGNLRHARKIFDVSAQNGGVKRIQTEVFKVCASGFSHKITAGFGGLGAVIIGFIEGKFVHQNNFVGFLRASTNRFFTPLKVTFFRKTGFSFSKLMSSK